MEQIFTPAVLAQVLFLLTVRYPRCEHAMREDAAADALLLFCTSAPENVKRSADAARSWIATVALRRLGRYLKRKRLNLRLEDIDESIIPKEWGGGG